jgi:hypothetical protein
MVHAKFDNANSCPSIDNLKFCTEQMPNKRFPGMDAPPNNVAALLNINKIAANRWK